MKTQTYEVEITYDDEGNKTSEKWFQNGDYHRLDGPAVQIYHENGINEEYWFENGNKIRGNSNSNIINIDGKEVSEETILEALKNYFK